jgi:hypothetical protein
MSGFKCGIVGLPNVGKSTLFSALSGVAAEAANYPFCTVEPNIAMVEVPDERLTHLSQWVKTQKIIPAVVEFVDIAGLIRGASKGEGLGNQFLDNIRGVDAIVQVLRCFESGNIVHVEGKVDPIADLETVQMELALADLEGVDKRLENLHKKARTGDKDVQELVPLLQEIQAALGQGTPARKILIHRKLSDSQIILLKELRLLTAKPQLYVANIGEDEINQENNHLKRVRENAEREHVEWMAICASLEAEVNLLEEEERKPFLEELQIKERGLHRLIRSGYALLGLLTFFTVGPKEIRAWTVPNGASAPQAAGTIHTDFEKGFIRAETYHYDDLKQHRSEKAVKEAGKMRMEGKDYQVRDGDIMHFHFND